MRTSRSPRRACPSLRESPGRTLVFALDTAHADDLALAWMREAGKRKSEVRLQVVHTNPINEDVRGACQIPPTEGESKFSSEDRNRIANAVRSGKIDVIISVDLYAMGVDFPCVENLFLARPTFSPVRYMQMIGRGSRGPAFGGTKRCLVVDFCDQVEVLHKVVDLLMDYSKLKDPKKYASVLRSQGPMTRYNIDRVECRPALVRIYSTLGNLRIEREVQDPHGMLSREYESGRKTGRFRVRYL